MQNWIGSLPISEGIRSQRENCGKLCKVFTSGRANRRRKISILHFASIDLFRRQPDCLLAGLNPRVKRLPAREVATWIAVRSQRTLADMLHRSVQSPTIERRAPAGS
jgi:hypothetical protein